MNLESRSLMIDFGMPQYFTCLKNNRDVLSTVQSFEATMKIPYFELGESNDHAASFVLGESNDKVH